MSAAHTAGPWKLSQVDPCAVMVAHGPSVGLVLANVTQFVRTHRAESDANARLIAAAPTMESALLEVLDAVRDYLPPDGISVEEAMNRIIGAVDNPTINPVLLAAKALGRTPNGETE